jgi:hypothetical protein
MTSVTSVTSITSVASITMMFVTLFTVFTFTATRWRLTLTGIRTTTDSRPRTAADGSAQNSTVSATYVLTNRSTCCATQSTAQNRTRINSHRSTAG